MSTMPQKADVVVAIAGMIVSGGDFDLMPSALLGVVVPRFVVALGS